jgi:hypothetical protein
MEIIYTSPRLMPPDLSFAKILSSSLLARFSGLLFIYFSLTDGAFKRPG